MQKTISIIVPLYNEEKNIPLIYAGIKKALDTLGTYTYEIIFVDDGSKDNSQKALANIVKSDPVVRVIEFTRNFGKEAATTAGINSAVGDAILTIDADLQHPPELIPKFISLWEKGAEIVIGIRIQNKGEGFVKRYGSKLFHFIMGWISETELTPGETDFRLIDRAVADAFKHLQERGRMTRALINWLGFRKETIKFKASARLHGEAQYSTGKLMHLAIHSFVSNSLLPLRLAGYLGLVITVLSGGLGTAVFFERYVFSDSLNWHVSGSAQLAIINVFLIGVVLMALGIMALYIGRINEEISRRPLYVMRKSKG